MVLVATSHLSTKERHLTAAQRLMNLTEDRGVPRRVVLSQAAANGVTACVEHDQRGDPGEH